MEIAADTLGSPLSNQSVARRELSVSRCHALRSRSITLTLVLAPVNGSRGVIAARIRLLQEVEAVRDLLGQRANCE